MSIQPFVGVCGLQHNADFIKLLQLAPATLEGTDRFLMAGLKKPVDVAILHEKSDMVRPFVHCDFTDQESFEQTVERNIYQSKKYVRGLQLNVLPWMEVDFAPLWRKLKAQYPDISLMLQAHRIVMEQYTPQQIANRLRGLSVDYILFDPSQSNGVAYQPVHMRSYVDAVHQEQLNLAVAVAGGLCGSTMSNLFAPLVQTYPTLSCDSFNKLQHPTTQRLSWPRVDAYLSAWRTSLDIPYYSRSLIKSKLPQPTKVTCRIEQERR